MRSGWTDLALGRHADMSYGLRSGCAASVARTPPGQLMHSARAPARPGAFSVSTRRAGLRSASWVRAAQGLAARRVCHDDPGAGGAAARHVDARGCGGVRALPAAHPPRLRPARGRGHLCSGGRRRRPAGDKEIEHRRAGRCPPNSLAAIDLRRPNAWSPRPRDPSHASFFRRMALSGGESRRRHGSTYRIRGRRGSRQSRPAPPPDRARRDSKRMRFGDSCADGTILRIRPGGRRGLGPDPDRQGGRPPRRLGCRVSVAATAPAVRRRGGRFWARLSRIDPRRTWPGRSSRTRRAPLAVGSAASR